VRSIITTLLEVSGIGGLVAAAALSPLPWLAFAVGGAGLILISRGIAGGGTE